MKQIQKIGLFSNSWNRAISFLKVNYTKPMVVDGRFKSENQTKFINV